MEDIRNFIDLLAQDNNIEARESLEEILASRAFDALDNYKKEIASTLFTGTEIPEVESQQTTEVTDQE